MGLIYTLERVLRDVGAQEAAHKAVPSSFVVKFLGVLFNLLEMTVSVTPE